MTIDLGPMCWVVGLLVPGSRPPAGDKVATVLSVGGGGGLGGGDTKAAPGGSGEDSVAAPESLNALS